MLTVIVEHRKGRSVVETDLCGFWKLNLPIHRGTQVSTDRHFVVTRIALFHEEVKSSSSVFVICFIVAARVLSISAANELALTANFLIVQAPPTRTPTLTSGRRSEMLDSCLAIRRLGHIISVHTFDRHTWVHATSMRGILNAKLFRSGPKLRGEHKDDVDDSEDDIQFVEDRPVHARRSFGGRGGKVVKEAGTGKVQQLHDTLGKDGITRGNAGEERTLEKRLKRVRTERSTEESNSKRQKIAMRPSGPGEHAARLTGRMTVPKDAQRIDIPRRLDNEPEDVSIVRHKPLVHRFPGSIKPLNTLAESRSGRPAGSNHTFADPPFARYSSTREVRHKAVRSAASPSAGRDEFAVAERTPKRQKVRTDMDSQKDVAHVPNGDSLVLNDSPIITSNAASKPIRPCIKQSTVDLSEISEITRAYKQGDAKKQRRRRSLHRPGGVTSSQGSSRDVSFPHEVHPKSPGASNTKMTSSTEVINASPSPPRASMRHWSSETDGIPLIDLPKGIDLSWPSTKPSEAVRPSATQQVVSERRSVGFGRFEQRGHQDVTLKRQEITRKQSNNGSLRPRPMSPDDTPLRKTFQRDERPPNNAPRSKATLRMDVSQKRVVDRVSPISDDELAGDSTALKRGDSQDQSPAKRSRKMPQKHLSSPFDIHATLSTQPGKSLGLPKAQSLKRDEPIRAQILSFYSKACVMTSESNMWLKSDDSEGTIDLYHDHQPKVYEGRHQVVGLVLDHVKRIDASLNIEKVHISSATDELSNGHTCIQFADFEGVEWFINTVQRSHPAVSLKTEDDVRMENLFQHQSQELQKSYVSVCSS
nr:hypothetical protein CFP56_58820 [Quercus suber]